MVSESVRVRVTRTWPLKQYESYRVTVDVPIIDGKPLEVEPRIVLSAARYAADRCHEAWDQYNAERNLINAPGGDFQSAREAGDAAQKAIEEENPEMVEALKRERRKASDAESARRNGAEQGGATADSPKPEPEGRGDGAGAEDPRPTLATPGQLSALEDRIARDEDGLVDPYVEKFLKLRGVKIAGQLTETQMKELHSDLNNSKHRATA